MVIVVIAAIILGVVVFKLLLPLLGEMIGVIMGGLLLLGAVALCVAFPPLIIVFVIIGFIVASNKKSKE